MFTSMILLICMYPMMFIMYFLIKNEATPRKNYFFGASFTREQLKDEALLLVMKQYKRQMRIIFLVMMIAPLIILVIPWTSVSISIWMIWLIIGIYIFFIPFAVSNEKVKRIKEEKGWKRKESRVLCAEIKDASGVWKIHMMDFVPACVICLAAFVGSFFLPNEDLRVIAAFLLGCFSLTTFLFYGAALIMDRQKIRVISMDSYVNMNYARARRSVWKTFWLCGIWMNTLCVVTLFILFWFSKEQYVHFLWEMVIYSIMLTILALITYNKIRKIDETYHDRMDYIPNDDDDYWKWGMIYNNPKDHHFMVEKRMGMGNSVNMATTGGKIFGLFMGLLQVGVVGAMIFLMMLEFTPIHISVKTGILTAHQIQNDYEIVLDKIDKIELLEKLPRLTRDSGTGMDTLQKGNFHVPEEGSCKVFLNPQNGIFIKIEAGGVTYYLSGQDDEETKEVYEQILNR